MAKLLQLSRPSRRVREVVRAWWAMRRQKRRRKAAGASPVPNAPSSLVADDLGGAVGLAWDMSGGEGELGCEIERKVAGVGYEFELFGSTGPDVNHFEGDVLEGGTWDFRVRAFNAVGYSGYSNVVTVEFL